jgi:long-subunit fatty acid transport protein
MLKISRAGVLGAALMCALAGLAPLAHAGGFSVREQSTTFLGSAFAGSAAGGDISSMYWNPAAAAAVPGCSTSSSYTLIIGRSDETAQGGLFATGTPVAPGLSPTSTDVGSDVLVPASYLACQLTDKLFAGLALNSPFGFLTKPEDSNWAGSPFAITSKAFSANVNPTLAYRLTPTLTVGAGVQVEYFRLRLRHGAFTSPLLGTLAGSREYEAEDVGVGGTAGVIWQPLPGSSLGVGYRSAVGLDVGGWFRRNPGLTTDLRSRPMRRPASPFPRKSASASARRSRPIGSCSARWNGRTGAGSATWPPPVAAAAPRACARSSTSTTATAGSTPWAPSMPTALPWFCAPASPTRPRPSPTACVTSWCPTATACS